MSDRYSRIDMGVICRILEYLKSGSKRILRLQQHCYINAKTSANSLDFLVKMGWVTDKKEERRRTVEITQEGRRYHEKFCNG